MVATENRDQGVAHRATPRTHQRNVRWGPRVVGAVVLVAGIVLLRDAINSANEYGLSRTGPWIPPLVVSSFWVVLAVVYLLRQLIAPHVDYPPGLPARTAVDRTGDGSTDDTGDGSSDGASDGVADGGAPSSRTQFLTPVALVATLIANALVLETVGFILASAGFFVVSAQLLGRRGRTAQAVGRDLMRDTVVGIALALVVYLFFTRFLDINLPAGVLSL